MFIGGASGSVAGGIKVNTFAVIIAAVISSVKGRPQTEAFGREIPQRQVLRALTVGVLGMGLIIIIMPTLTLTEPDIAFLDLLFDAVSAFGTAGVSTGIVPDLSLAGKIIFIVTMFIGRLGPLTLALALAPREQPMYRFIEERVTIG
jgi:trk system potassium uptake protein TrkH